jgi:hypothetical protein
MAGDDTVVRAQSLWQAQTPQSRGAGLISKDKNRIEPLRESARTGPRLPQFDPDLRSEGRRTGSCSAGELTFARRNPPIQGVPRRWISPTVTGLEVASQTGSKTSMTQRTPQIIRGSGPGMRTT